MTCIYNAAFFNDGDYSHQDLRNYFILLTILITFAHFCGIICFGFTLEDEAEENHSDSDNSSDDDMVDANDDVFYGDDDADNPN